MLTRDKSVFGGLSHGTIKWVSNVNEKANDSNQDGDLDAHQPCGLTGDLQIQPVNPGVETAIEGADAPGKFVTETIHFLIKGANVGSEFVANSIDLLVQPQDMPVSADNQLMKFPDTPGVFFHFAFQISDTFFQSRRHWDAPRKLLLTASLVMMLLKARRLPPR